MSSYSSRGYGNNSDDNDSDGNSESYVVLNDTAEDGESVTSSASKQFNREEEAKKRILIFNLNEQFGDDHERVAADINEVQQIFIAIGAKSAAIKKIFRAGDFQPNSPPRRIHVLFESESDRILVLQNAFKLKNILKWSNIALVAYMTQQQKLEKKNRRHVPQSSDHLTSNYQQQNMRPQPTRGRQNKPAHNFSTQSNNNFNQYNPYTQHGQNPHFPPQPPHEIFRNYSQSQGQHNPQFPMHPPYNASGNFNPYAQPSHLHNPYSGNPNLQLDPVAMAAWKMYHVQLNSNQSERSDGEPAARETSNKKKFAKKNMPPKFKKTANESEEENETDGSSSRNLLFKAQMGSHAGTKKVLNILVLGETEIGKSTWINGIANYMTFETFDDAIEATKPICLIASKFMHYETVGNGIEVKMVPSHGDTDEKEVLSDGQSATQEPKTYQFETSKYIVNIIDTPGIGDTRGIEQDKENTKKILNAIGQYKVLHAICFLFKADQPKLNTSFRFCIGEILLQLHKSAVENIVFFFTHSRTAFYSAGQTINPLREYLNELEKDRNLRIPLKDENQFFLDNEAFKLVCAHANGVHFAENVVAKFAKSWERSAAETNRFLEFAADRPAHQVSDTLSINKARTIILHLAKPLADVNELIESNIKIYNDRQNELHHTANDMKDLEKKLKITYIGIEIQPLPYPKTVCAATKCTEVQDMPNTGQKRTIYSTICHSHCYLTGVEVEKNPEPHLVGCAAMAGQPNCQVCRCPWQEHMHIRFDQIKTTMEMEDTNAKEYMKKTGDASATKQIMIQDCQKKIDELKAEQQKIMKTSLRFGGFLQANAILPYNDAFEKYVEQTINEEEKCVQIGGNRSKLDNLKKLLAYYQEEKRMLNEAAKNILGNNPNSITPDEIEVLKAELFVLKFSGKTLENLFKATEDGIALNNNYATVKYKPEIKKPKGVHYYGNTQKDNNKPGPSHRGRGKNRRY